ncbi:hypothetical protein AB0N81_38200 [Streptomyces sp. NPDC093510]|uniref:hypothetical protein n=1 Tax=Streptomyces sp. NPDC093510 TaxID=3155199 RepID=UPI003414D34B
MDGFTHALFASRVAAVYTALTTGARHQSHFPADLRRVVEADTDYQRSDAFRDDGDFWRAKLAEQTDFASLTTWRPPPSAESFRENGRLEPEDAAVLRDYAGAPATVHNLNSGPVEDLAVNVYNRGPAEGMHIAFDGNIALYTREELARHVCDFVALLRSLRDLAESGPVAPSP